MGTQIDQTKSECQISTIVTVQNVYKPTEREVDTHADQIQSGDCIDYVEHQEPVTSNKSKTENKSEAVSVHSKTVYGAELTFRLQKVKGTQNNECL